MSIKDVTPQEAFKTLQEDKETSYLDVRTVSEFVAGHPRNAVNVPVLLPDSASGQMSPNSEFLAVIEARFPKEARIIVGCMSGMRSQFAADLMQKAGYQNVSNMQGGLGGVRDARGQIVKQGWRDAGLPVESGDGGAASYEAVLKKTKAQQA
jgi:rhodanese-related sulfurtransferase